MWSIVTGASSGIGRDIARYLYTNYNSNLVLVARNEDRLYELKNELESNKRDNIVNKDTKIEDLSRNEDKSLSPKNKKSIDKKIIVIPEDLSKKEDCIDLFEKTKEIDVDLLVNNAGFGVFGEFLETDLENEINLINTNITAVHVLTKVYLKEMLKKNRGHILNVASIAGMEPGPLMAAYYASKAYVIRLSRAINKEIKKKKSNVKISILCPGPVNTNFNNVAKVVFKAPSMSSKKVAKIAIDKALKGKLIIIPGILNKSVRLFSKILPDCILEECAYHIQRRKKI